MAIEVGTAYVSILPSTRGFSSALSKQLSSASAGLNKEGDKAGTSFGDSLRAGATRILKRGLIAGAAGASLLGGAGLKTAAELEQSKLGFETMLGSAKKADAFMAQVKDAAKKTPFELKGLTQSSQRLLAFGFSAKDVIPTLTTLGDAAAGLGLGQEGLDRATMAVGQIMAKGKVQAEEMLQLTELGIPANKILRNQLGMTTDEYEKAQRAGKITADVAIPALLDGIKSGTDGMAGHTAAFGGLMEKQSKSLTGLFENLKDTVLVGIAEQIEPLMPLLKTGLAGAIEIAGAAIKGIGTVMGPFVSLLVKGKDYIAALAAGVTAAGVALIAYNAYVKVSTTLTKAWTVAQKLLNGTMKANPVGLVVTAIGLLVAALVLAYKKSETFRKIVDKTWATVKKAIKTAWAAVKPVLNAFKTVITKGLGPAVKWLWDKAVKPAFNNVRDKIANVWGAVKGKFQAWTSFLRENLGPRVKWLYRDIVKPVFTSIRDKVTNAWSAIKGRFQAWAEFFRDTLGPRVRWLYRDVVNPVFSNIREKIANVWGAVRGTLTAMKDFFVHTLGPKVRSAINSIGDTWNNLKSAAKAPVRFLIETVYNNGLRKLIGALPGVSTPSAVSLPKGFADGGWTGPGGKFTPAGIVHADEFVLTKFARNRLESQNPGALDYMNRTGRWPGYASGGRVWPVPGTRTSTYAGHDGVDINRGAGWDDFGDPIWAAAGGTISYVGTGRGYGLATFITGPYGELVYGHMSKAYGRAGASVRAGTLIGRVGNTGRSSAPHLHFGFPGGSYGAALAFLAGANVSGGSSTKPESKVGGFLIGKWKDAIDTIKDVVSSAKGWFKTLSGDGWPGIFGKVAKSLGRSAVDWVNDKIPNKFLPDNPIPTGIFDNGGILAPGMLAYNASTKPEAVFNHEQFRQFAEMRQTPEPRRAAPVVENLTLQSTGNTRDDLDEVLFQLRRLERGGTR